MKRLFSFGVVLVFCLQLTGFYCYYFFKTIHLQHQARQLFESTPLDKLDHFTVSVFDYKTFVSGENEIEVRGKMFDVAGARFFGDSVMVFGKYDDDEDNLLAMVRSTFSAEPLRDEPLPIAVLSIFGQHYLASGFAVSFSVPVAACSPEPKYSSRLLDFNRRIPTPPPQS